MQANLVQKLEMTRAWSLYHRGTAASRKSNEENRKRSADEEILLIMRKKKLFTVSRVKYIDEGCGTEEPKINTSIQSGMMTTNCIIFQISSKSTKSVVLSWNQTCTSLHPIDVLRTTRRF